ncbi:MAG: rhomboid family intramembrane serine protease [Flavobacteriales bacterium]
MSSVAYFWKTSNAAVKLIIVNVAVFFLVQFVFMIFHLMDMKSVNRMIVDALALPAYLPKLILQPWSLFTHMFMHQGIFHILFNMIMLYFGGRLFTYYLDDRRLINVYFLSGLSGAFLFLLAANIFPLFKPYIQNYNALGASAATLGVLIAICAYRPQDKVQLFLFGGVKLMWIGIIIIAIDVLRFTSGNEGGYIAHFGGAAFGYMFGVNMRQYKDISRFFQPVQNLFERLVNPQRSRRKKSPLKTVYRRKSDESFNEERAKKQKRMDDILDKIKASGYDSLSADEKRFLFDMSKEL